jgi:cytochrome P450
MGRPNLSDLEHFWTAPIAERAAAFASLREHEPVPFFPEPTFGMLPPGPGYWALTRFDDVVEASRTPKVFTSGAGATNITDLPPEFLEFFGSMINLDDPRHSRLRRIVSRGFTPKRLAALTEEVQRTASRIVDDALAQGECDAVTAISARLPLKIVCDMMGVPESQYEFVYAKTNTILGVSDPEYVEETADVLTAVLQAGHALAELMRELGRTREQQPTDDVTSALVNAEIDGERLTPDELASFFILLVVAGNETTRNAITHGMNAFFDHPEQWELFKASRPDTAADEIVRWATPITVFQRTATRDVELGGQQIKAGQRLGLFYRSANFDEEVFEEPGRFDIGRNPNPHLGYGGLGTHYCLGASLAKLEIELIFTAIADAMPDIAKAGDPVRLRSGWINGIKSLPVTYRP